MLNDQYLVVFPWKIGKKIFIFLWVYGVRIPRKNGGTKSKSKIIKKPPKQNQKRNITKRKRKAVKLIDNGGHRLYRIQTQRSVQYSHSLKNKTTRYGTNIFFLSIKVNIYIVETGFLNWSKYHNFFGNLSRWILIQSLSSSMSL